MDITTIPTEFARCAPVAYSAWRFSCRRATADFDRDKLSYTPRLIFVQSGRCRFQFPGAWDRVISPGEIVYIPPAAVYSTDFLDGRLASLNLFFDFPRRARTHRASRRRFCGRFRRSGAGTRR